MSRLKPFLWLAVAVAAGGALWTARHRVPAPAAAGADLYCGFEGTSGWDISPEEGFTLERSTEHVTEGSASLKVVFPAVEYPSINTKRLTQPVARYDDLVFDVFNPQDHPVKFGVRLDDRARKRLTVERTLEPGANHLSVSRGEIARKLDPARLAFVVLFIDSTPEEPLTLYFDNLRLASAAPPAPEPAPTPQAGSTEQPTPAASGSTDARSQTVSVPELSLPALPPRPQPPTSGELRVAVVRLRDGQQPTALLSQGLPFAPGQLRSERDVALLTGSRELPLGVKVLARWPQDGSIRSLLVQARLDAGQMNGPVTIRWGAPRAAAEIPLEPVAWETPEAWLQLPAQWLCDSEVIGELVPMGETDMPEYDERIDQYYADRRDDPPQGDIREDGYYSTPHVFYQLYVRSGDLDIFLAARRELLGYREHELILDGPERGRHRRHLETRYVYVEALADDYLLTGDERSKEVAGMMVEYLLHRFPPAKALYPKGATGFWTEREAAFPLLGILHAYGITGDPALRQAADEMVESLYQMQRQWPGRGGFIHNLYAHDTEEGCRPDEYGGSPFMTGLLLEGLIDYHRLTGSPTAARAIFLALDWLMREGLNPDGEEFLYLTCDYQREEADPTPDLNFLVVHGFGYGYRLSGYQRQDYLELAHRLLDRGVRDAYLKDRKHFNQNFRSSGHYFAYVRAAAAAQASTPQDPATLFRDSFDESAGRWSSPGGDASLEVDRAAAFAGPGALKISSAAASSKLTAGWSVEAWDLEPHPVLRFAYRIPRGVPVGLRVQTQFGDWVSLGGTVGEPNDAAVDGEPPRLLDDDQWHEAVIDVGAMVRRVLPAVRLLMAFRFAAASEAGADRHFWIDEFRVGAQ